MNKKDLKEKVIVGGIMTAIFLPVRFVFFTYVSKYWFGSVGLVSIVAVTMHILSTKNKLGKFGTMYQNQTRKIMTGKLGIPLIVLSIILIIYLGVTPYLIEKANTTYFAEKEFYSRVFKFAMDHTTTGKSQQFEGQIPYEKLLNGNLTPFQQFERSFAITASIANDFTNGWVLHFYTVGFVGQVEYLGILLFYRFMHRKKN
jgi:hypothetical protein